MRSQHAAARQPALEPAPQPVGRGVDVSFASVPAAAAAARSAVVDAFAGHVDDGVLADAVLLVSELVSNGVRHAGLTSGEVLRVGAHITDGVLRLEVDNPRCFGTIAARDPDPAGGGGLGLWIVEALADGWGVARENHTRVWAELVCGPATAQAGG